MLVWTETTTGQRFSRHNLVVWDHQRDKLVIHRIRWQHSLGHPESLLQFLPDGKSVIFVCRELTKAGEERRTAVLGIDVASGKIQKSFVLDKGRGAKATLTPDGKTLIVSSLFESAVLYDLEKGKEIAVLKGDEKMPGSLPNDADREAISKWRKNNTSIMTVSPDRKWLALSTYGSWISIWDLARRRRLWRERGHDTVSGGASSLSFSRDGETLVSAGANERVIFWERKTGHRVRERNFMSGADMPMLGCHYAAYLPDGKLLLGECQTWCGFLAWDTKENVLLGKSWHAPFRHGMRGATKYTLSADGSTLASDFKGHVYIWDLRKIWPR